MFGAELFLLAAQPTNEAQPLFDIAVEACSEWVNNEQYRTGSAQEFVERSGLGEKGLVVPTPDIDDEGSKRYFQVGTRNFFKIEAAARSPQCRFSGFGDREFWADVREAIDDKEFLASWPLVDSFFAHRMYADLCYRSAQEPRTELHIRYGYFVRRGNDADFVGSVTQTTENEPCPFILNL